MNNWLNDEQFLLDIEAPKPSTTYAPIQHHVFINEVSEYLDKQGLSICSKKYLPGSKGQIMVGEYGICQPNNTSAEAIMALGFQNSYNKTKTAALYSGFLELVCSNGCYTTRQGAMYTRKHTGTALADLRKQISISVENMQTGFEELMRERQEMKERKLTKQIIAQLIGDMYINESIITSTQVSIIKNQMYHSVDFKGTSAFSLFNWITESLKQSHASNYIGSHLKVHTYISNKLELSTFRKDIYGKLEVAK